LVADLKRLYFTAGVENKPTVFLFVDTQVVEEVFLEDISNILSSGEVPNLYKPDEFEEVNPLYFPPPVCKTGRGYWNGRRPPPPPRLINVLISLKILSIDF
jgi:hypothetical protein